MQVLWGSVVSTLSLHQDLLKFTAPASRPLIEKRMSAATTQAVPLCLVSGSIQEQTVTVRYPESSHIPNPNLGVFIEAGESHQGIIERRNNRRGIPIRGFIIDGRSQNTGLADTVPNRREISVPHKTAVSLPEGKEA